MILAGAVSISAIRPSRDAAKYVHLQMPRDIGNGVSGLTSPRRVLTEDVLQIAIVGHSSQVDASNQTVSIGWEVLGCGEYRLGTVDIAEIAPAGCGALDRAVDVYFNA